jgi:hypothetical protein
MTWQESAWLLCRKVCQLLCPRRCGGTDSHQSPVHAGPEPPVVPRDHRRGFGLRPSDGSHRPHRDLHHPRAPDSPTVAACPTLRDHQGWRVPLPARNPCSAIFQSAGSGFDPLEPTHYLDRLVFWRCARWAPHTTWNGVRGVRALRPVLPQSRAPPQGRPRPAGGAGAGTPRPTAATRKA